MVNDIVNNIRLTQEIFNSSTPIRPTNGGGSNSSTTGKKKTDKNKQHSGMLPKHPKPAKQNIYAGASTHKSTDNNNNDYSDSDDDEIDRAVQQRIAAAMHNYASHRRGQSGSDQESSLASSSLPLEEVNPPQATENKAQYR